MIGWFIRKARNDHVFNHSLVDIRHTLQKIADTWLELKNQVSGDDGLTTTPITHSDDETDG